MWRLLNESKGKAIKKTIETRKDHYKEVRESVSDYLPIFIELDTSKDLYTLEVGLDKPSEKLYH